jgi:hypothetical protein
VHVISFIGLKFLQIDVLYPSINELEQHLSISYKKAAKKVAETAVKSAKGTKNMIPKYLLLL